MEIFDGHQALFRPLCSPVVALGNFDGVHIGHQQLLRRTRQAADQHACDAVVYTFAPHPAEVLAPNRAPTLITTLDRRLELFAHYDMDVCIVEPFTPALAALPADDFLERILVGTLKVQGIVVGYDFTYGRDRAGTTKTLDQFGQTKSIRVEIVPKVIHNDIVVSSTNIRDLVRRGDMSGARTLLGRLFEIDGTVTRGAGRGKKIGIPTANIVPATPLLPATGVYAVQVQLLASPNPSEIHPGVANLGKKPTFGPDHPQSLEVHLLDFEADIYDQPVRVQWIARLRQEQQFPDVNQLVTQIRKDIDRARTVLGSVNDRVPRQ